MILFVPYHLVISQKLFIFAKKVDYDQNRISVVGCQFVAQ